MKSVIAAMTASIFICAIQSTYASEGDVYGGPIGGTDIRNAYLPNSPGLYIGLVNSPGVLRHINDNTGNPTASIKETLLQFDIQAAELEYVYPTKLFGGTVASQIEGGYAPLARFSINNEVEHFEGWMDPYVDVVKWSKHLAPLATTNPSGPPNLPYGLTVMAAYSMIIPVGTYDKTKFDSPGHNTWFIIPNAAISYLTGPNLLGDGVEFSAHLFDDYSTKNAATNYKSGSVLDLDFAISERAGLWQYGVAGFWSRQIDDDRQNGAVVAVDGHRLQFTKLGPVVAYTIPKWHIFLKFKATYPIPSLEKNGIYGDQWVLVAGFKI